MTPHNLYKPLFSQTPPWYKQENGDLVSRQPRNSLVRIKFAADFTASTLKLCTTHLARTLIPLETLSMPGPHSELPWFPQPFRSITSLSVTHSFSIHTYFSFCNCLFHPLDYNIPFHCPVSWSTNKMPLMALALCIKFWIFPLPCVHSFKIQ